MATFIALITETQFGETHIDESVGRATKFRDEAGRCGAKITGMYWTLGSYDGVLVFEAPDDETAAALLYQLGSKGAVRTQTLRAFNVDETRAILKGIEQKQ
jgi:uncharacterized protein with GYD domain